MIHFVDSQQWDAYPVSGKKVTRSMKTRLRELVGDGGKPSSKRVLEVGSLVSELLVKS